MEWADLIRELLPEEHVYITIVKKEGEKRVITVKK
jgi:tRNA A37 threonylcarbamoyladenosine biosynthesis protein TsaE